MVSKKYFMKRIFIFAIASVLISSCASNETADSSGVKQTEIYQTYRINWQNGAGSCTASFRFGGENGTTLRLSEPSKVTINEQEMTEGKFLFGGAFYEADQQKYSAKHLYKFRDTDGKVYENGYDFEDVEFINPPTTVSKNANMILELNRQINSSENIYMEADQDTVSSNTKHITGDSTDAVYFDASHKRVIIKPEFFQGFTDIPVSIFLYKMDLVKPLNQHGNQTGELHFNFQSNVFVVKRRALKSGV
jgi:hypothetical protein